MAYAQLLACMAHQPGGFYDLPHGVCNAILLPHVQADNARVCPERLRDVAKAPGEDVSGLSVEKGAEKAIVAIKSLSARIDIPQGLKPWVLRMRILRFSQKTPCRMPVA